MVEILTLILLFLILLMMGPFLMSFTKDKGWKCYCGAPSPDQTGTCHQCREDNQI